MKHISLHHKWWNTQRIGWLKHTHKKGVSKSQGEWKKREPKLRPLPCGSIATLSLSFLDLQIGRGFFSFCRFPKSVEQGRIRHNQRQKKQKKEKTNGGDALISRQKG